MKRTVLLLGGTGAIGVYLAQELVSLGYDVVITSRSRRSDAEGIRFVQGDALNLAFLTTLLRDVKPDAIVDFMIYPTIEFLDRHRLLLNSTSHYLFLSSYTVFADNSPLVEDSPRLLDVCGDANFLKTDDYPLRKARCENILRMSGYNNWTILRPSITYSKERFQFGCLEANVVCYRSLQHLPVVIPKEILSKRTTLTWAGDTGKMISRLVMNDEAKGEAVDLATAESLTWREIADIYSEAIGMKFIEVCLSDYIDICGLSAVMYDRMCNRYLDNSKVLRLSGLKQEDLMPIAKGLRKELSGFVTCPHYAQIDLAANAKLDRLCGTRISLSGLSFRDRCRYRAIRYKSFGAMYSFASELKRLIRR